MVDVVICYAREDGALARQLAGAVARLGHRLWSEDEADGDVTDRIGAAKAAIVLWSQAAAASDWVRAEANYARGQNKLIQASADDAPPPLPFRAADIVPLAGWRGEETHPGWRRIRARLEALCGAPAASRPVRAGAAAPAAPAAHRRGGGLLVLITLAFLAAVGLATFVWMRGLAPTAAPRQAAPPPPMASPAAPAPALPPPTAAPEPSPPEPDAGPVEAPPPPPIGPRINRRNAENMRLFCERAGRGTPQCRTFERQLRNQRR